jgi:hypothetical protein
MNATNASPVEDGQVLPLPDDARRLYAFLLPQVNVNHEPQPWLPILETWFRQLGTPQVGSS